MAKERTARRREENEIEFSRIVAFSDGVFAIAITLLVLQLEVPDHIPGDELNRVLWDQRQDILAYVISFAVIGRFWIIHHRFFGSVTGAIVLYAINLAGVTLVGTLMAADAHRAGLTRMSEEEVREGRRRSGLATLLWLALFADPVGRRMRGRRRG